ncbi:MAG TPA: GNAT family protein [Ktedonobacterales bacterium]|jgi:RimJ/RimL family protein N-acetyltransferase|nr:GNAT family protein [Ktedonobacterales bacterium]
MSFSFSPMTEDDARAILAWRYDGPYAVYNAPDQALAAYSDALAEMLDARSPYFAVREQGQAGAQPIGFCAYGSACEVGADETRGLAAPYVLRPDGSLTIGLGLRPDLTGQGRGLALVEAGLAFARERYDLTLFRLYVFAWNQRAIRVYERAGFTTIGETRPAAPEGERVFIEMTRPVER